MNISKSLLIASLLVSGVAQADKYFVPSQMKRLISELKNAEEKIKKYEGQEDCYNKQLNELETLNTEFKQQKEIEQLEKKKTTSPKEYRETKSLRANWEKIVKRFVKTGGLLPKISVLEEYEKTGRLPEKFKL